jgi:translation initiation factor IF-2
MSIRIHKLAEELGLDNKEMMALLKERRIVAQDVKSVSSTVDNINASALREEFAARNAATAPAATATAPEPAPAAPAAPLHPDAGTMEASATKVVIPSGVFVKSKQDIDREKEAAAAARAAALKPAGTAAASGPPFRPVTAPQPAATPRYVSAPPPVARMPVTPPSSPRPSPPAHAPVWRDSG